MMKYWTIVCSGLLLAAFAWHTPALAHEGSHDGVSFAKPHDGGVVGRTFDVEMKVSGMDVHKAGDVIEGSGHHHLIIDGGCIKQGEAVPKDASHKHFGKGQTETELQLEPGKHTLSLQFANGHHQSYGRHWCKTIHVTVK